MDKTNLSFRMRNSLLKIDSYKMGFVSDNICANCNLQKQENLHHYIFECSKYRSQRKIFLARVAALAENIIFQNIK